MRAPSIIQAMREINRIIFTTKEIAAIRGASVSTTTQSLARLEKQGILRKILKGLWGVPSDKRFSPLLVIPYLAPHHRSYLSFICALHLHGVISQIPQVITVATTAHSKRVKSSIGTFVIHQIAPEFFDGFEWNATEEYLVATAEKALADCLYLASRKGRQYAHFPELDLGHISLRKATAWLRRMRDVRIRKATMSMMKSLLEKK